MAEIVHVLNGGMLTLKISGNIDSSNAPEIEERINAIREETSPAAVTVDCEKLGYISSAGLRIVLRLKKAVADTELVNVSPDVYEIFEMTGFTEMMTVRKAFRTVSVDGCEVIGSGANGRVYRIDPETIVKVYLDGDSLADIRRERDLARAAFILGVPTAIPYDIVRVEGGGYGSVFELLNATSYAKLLVSGEKTVDEVAKMSVDLLKLIHSTVVKPGTMPDMKEIVLGWAEVLRGHLPDGAEDKLVSLISSVPDDDHMLHGDYHIKNVMVQNGESLLIDMDTVCHGHPIFEFGCMYIAYEGFSALDHDNVKRFLGIPFGIAGEFWRKSLALYLGDEARVPEVEDKAKIVGFTRIMKREILRGGLENEEGRAVVENCRRELCGLLSRIDTLTF